MLTIYLVENDTSAVFFEDKEDAQRYQNGYGAASGLTLIPIQVLPSSHPNNQNEEKE